MSGQLNSVEIFAGGGGMALGMRRAGFSHEALVEWWAPAAKVLRHNAERDSSLWAKDHVFEKDVRKTTAELSELGPINLVAGGPPCQPFSLAGAGAGHSDERNMFPAALDIVRGLLPQYVVFENVPGLTRPSFAPYLDYVRDQLRRPTVAPKEGELWDEHHARIRTSRLNELYRVYQEEIDAADIGVAQSRKRIFLIAIRADLKGAGSWPGITRTNSRDVLLHHQWVTGTYWERHGLTKPEDVPERLKAQVERIKITGVADDRLAWKTLRDVLVDVPEPVIEKAPDGWPNHVAIPGARTYAKHSGSPLDMPSKTIKAGVHGVAGGEAMLRELDGTVRYLSIREAALVQGFPQDYEFPGVRSRVMGVIGNAVAVHVAAQVGRTLIALRADHAANDVETDKTEDADAVPAVGRSGARLGRRLSPLAEAGSPG
jgi:DNA (cytosine-5)-methyltransferase 1